MGKRAPTVSFSTLLEARDAMSCGAPKGTAIALRVLITPPSRSAESFRFADRRNAGIALARQLQQFANRNDVVVLALPRGGVPVAYEVARVRAEFGAFSDPRSTRVLSASTMATIVLRSESGLSEMLSMPCATKNWANSG